MPRDYAKNAKTKQRDPIPGWAWMFGGLAVGLFVAALVYLNEHTPKKNQQLLTNAVKRTIQDARKPKDDRKTANADHKRPRFDFYTILPELEVAIPEQELASPQHNTPSDNHKSAAKNTSPAQQAKGSFTLQAGSFRQREQADKLKAKLALQGVVANIQTVDINDGDTWHRVRIGPSNDLDELNRTRKRLNAIGVATIVVRNKN